MENKGHVQTGLNCPVCGDQRAGKHYNGLACFGVWNNRKYNCHNNKSCEIVKRYRNRCRACRFAKCLLVGLDPNAVQSERDKRSTKNQEKIQQNDEEFSEIPSVSSSESFVDTVEERTFLDVHKLDEFLRIGGIFLNWSDLDQVASGSNMLYKELLFAADWIRSFCEEFGIDYHQSFNILKNKMVNIAFLNSIERVSILGNPGIDSRFLFNLEDRFSTVTRSEILELKLNQEDLMLLKCLIILNSVVNDVFCASEFRTQVFRLLKDRCEKFVDFVPLASEDRFGRLLMILMEVEKMVFEFTEDVTLYAIFDRTDLNQILSLLRL
ncbi:hypothetical protein FO519_001289 [Halicephalobus sp. NKZ332]|nr:hypothetical protein FO519_001289 [Halicephalobus sp. NKZ332]